MRSTYAPSGSTTRYMQTDELLLVYIASHSPCLSLYHESKAIFQSTVDSSILYSNTSLVWFPMWSKFFIFIFNSSQLTNSRAVAMPWNLTKRVQHALVFVSRDQTNRCSSHCRSLTSSLHSSFSPSCFSNLDTDRHARAATSGPSCTLFYPRNDLGHRNAVATALRYSKSRQLLRQWSQGQDEPICMVDELPDWTHIPASGWHES